MVHTRAMFSSFVVSFFFRTFASRSPSGFRRSLFRILTAARVEEVAARTSGSRGTSRAKDNGCDCFEHTKVFAGMLMGRHRRQDDVRKSVSATVCSLNYHVTCLAAQECARALNCESIKEIIS